MTTTTTTSSTPATRIADAIEIADLQAELSTTAEYPAIGDELVAASTYRDEDLAVAMWQAAMLRLPVVDLATFGNANLVQALDEAC